MVVWERQWNGSREGCEGEIGDLRVEGVEWLCGRDRGVERVVREK